MRMSEKCHNNNYNNNTDNPLTCHRTDGGKNLWTKNCPLSLEQLIYYLGIKELYLIACLNYLKAAYFCWCIETNLGWLAEWRRRCLNEMWYFRLWTEPKEDNKRKVRHSYYIECTPPKETPFKNVEYLDIHSHSPILMQSTFGGW